MGRQLSRSEKARLILIGLVVLGCVAAAVCCMWVGLWVRGVFLAGMALMVLFHGQAPQ